ncbi:MAG TPA: NAD-dependent deacylase [Gemmatimonadaceae bacterium]|nr:NAD-dependent deacylase [Gemmatimonadaceae bacterium]
MSAADEAIAGAEVAIERLRAARRVAVLTGAGISAESGIPTFRDALTGLWARYRAEDLATPEAFARDPRLVWSWYRMRRAMVSSAAPNPGHAALARLEALVPHLTLITQNVDGLQQRAGSSRVLELHGNILRARCSREGAVVDAWEEPDDGEVPHCVDCDSLLRPDVVWFGEALPAAALEEAWAAATTCDVFLSVGTSNLVEPAASLPWVAAREGASVMVINPTAAGQRTGDGIHQLVGTAGEILPRLVSRLDRI